MTYGEWLYEKRRNMTIKEMNEEIDVSVAPKRMTERDALIYYTNKLNRYWEDEFVKAAKDAGFCCGMLKALKKLWLHGRGHG